jgi:hypothetical protein
MAFVMDAKPHTDGSQYAIGYVGPSGRDVGVETVKEARQQLVKFEASRKEHYPGPNQPGGKCLQNVVAIAGGLSEYSRRNDSRLPPGKDLKLELAGLVKNATDATWVCPETKKPYVMTAEALKLGPKGLKGIDRSRPLVLLVDSVPHGDGSRCAFVLGTRAVPVRLSAKEWEQLSRR